MLEVVEDEPERRLEPAALAHPPGVLLGLDGLEAGAVVADDGAVVADDAGTVTAGVEGLEGVELLGWGPSTQTMTPVNTTRVADATTAVTTSRRGRGGR